MRTWSSSFILQFHKSLPIISINNTILAIINGISKNSVSKLFGNGVLMQLPVFAPGTIHYNRNNIIWVSLTLISSILNLLNSLKTRSALGSTATLVIALASILIVLFILALSFIQRRFKNAVPSDCIKTQSSLLIWNRGCMIFTFYKTGNHASIFICRGTNG